MLLWPPDDRRSEHKARAGMAFRIRLMILVGMLALTVLWAVNDIHSRHARTQWERPVSVAIALVQLGPVDQAALKARSSRFPPLEDRLAAEYHGYGGPLAHPAPFTLYGRG